MADPNVSAQNVSERMREDWNARAREDAGYYVAFGQRDQDDAGFFATATQTVNGLEKELKRVPEKQRRGWVALEIGCGPGRLLRPMSRHFAEIHGVDVSDEMIALAKEKLRDTPNAHPQVCDGSRLTMFEDASIDYVYSYAVFQHIPSREVVLEYLREVRRVLKVGGLARLQINGLPRESDDAYTTWSGARFSSREVMELAENQDMQVLALEGAGTQYMWTTWRKHEDGWNETQARREFAEYPSRIRRITNASSSEPVAPSRGRFASISIWMENLPADASLQHLRVWIGDSLGTVLYIGAPDSAGLQQITVNLPELESTGLLPVEVRWMETPIAAPTTLRIIPRGPLVPAIRTITDGVNLVAGNRIETRLGKVVLEEIARPEEIGATIDGLPVWNLEYFCTEPKPQVYEVNFRVPDDLGPGYYPLQVSIGRRKLAAVTVQVV
jgi:ubiquinone/menaquinone biosynthesis C-methylase UbiE